MSWLRRLLGGAEATDARATPVRVRMPSRAGRIVSVPEFDMVGQRAEIAAANGGRYDVDAHLRHDPQATETLAQTHVRRLEAVRRLDGAVERAPDGSWIIAPDHLERAAAFEERQLRDRPREFTLVPWRPMLEAHVGKNVSGILRGDGINWTLGRGRGGPTIS